VTASPHPAGPTPNRLGLLLAAFTALPVRLRGGRVGRGVRIWPSASFRGDARRISLEAGSRVGPRVVLAANLGGHIRIGRHCDLHDGAILMAYGGEISLGDRCSVNPYCVLYGHGGLTIGSQVRIAAHVVMIPANHQTSETGVPIMDQGLSAEGITIEDDVWIGAGARILDGCTIGRGAVVAAGAVVTTDVEPFSIVGGVPARKLRTRVPAQPAEDSGTKTVFRQ